MKPNRIKLCKERGCRDEQTTDGFCRYHYLRNWKKLMLDRRKNKEKLEKYINVMAEKYSEEIVADDVRDDIIGRNTVKEHLSEIGLREEDLKRDTNGNPFQNVDVDDLVDNIRYDENY